MASSYDINGFRRIYFVHIRKTAGTSVNKMFISLGNEDSSVVYQNLVDSPEHQVISNGKILVGWNSELINAGRYFYGFSHIPLHQLNLRPGTFVFSSFRDPVQRVLSHYNMLMHYRVHAPNHPCMKIEGEWVTGSFDDFLDRIPKEHLQNQLYMFSEHFEVDEAVEKVKNLSHFFFSESFDRGVDELGKKTGLRLEPVHTRKAGYKSVIQKESIDRLRNMLVPEYEFLSRIA
ncbi:sulfotransferase family 2 domain-containing protein [Pseudomonadota bacterium]